MSGKFDEYYEEIDPDEKGGIPHLLLEARDGSPYGRYSFYDAMGLDWGDDAWFMRDSMEPGTPMIEVEFPDGERKRYIDLPAARKAVDRQLTKKLSSKSASNGPSAQELVELAIDTNTPDAFKTIHSVAFGYNDIDSMSVLDLDSMSVSSIEGASDIIAAKSQEMLRARGFNDTFIVYRSEIDGSQGVASVSHQRSGTLGHQDEFSVRLSDVLTYTEGIQPYASLLEMEIHVERKNLKASDRGLLGVSAASVASETPQVDHVGSTTDNNTVYRGMDIDIDDGFIDAIAEGTLDLYVRSLLVGISTGDRSQFSMSFGNSSDGVGVHWTRSETIARDFGNKTGSVAYGLYGSIGVVVEATYTPGDEMPIDDVHAYRWGGRDEREVPLLPGSPVSISNVSYQCPSDLDGFLSAYLETGSAHTTDIFWRKVSSPMMATAQKTALPRYQRGFGQSRRETYESGPISLKISVIEANPSDRFSSQGFVIAEVPIPWEGDLYRYLREVTREAKRGYQDLTINIKDPKFVLWGTGSNANANATGGTIGWTRDINSPRWARPAGDMGRIGDPSHAMAQALLGSTDRDAAWQAWMLNIANISPTDRDTHPGVSDRDTKITVYRGVSVGPDDDPTSGRLSEDSQNGKMGGSWTTNIDVAKAISERGMAGFNFNNSPGQTHKIRPGKGPSNRPYKQKAIAAIPTVLRAEVDLGDNASLYEGPGGYRYLKAEQEVDIPRGTEFTMTGWMQADEIPVNPSEARAAWDQFDKDEAQKKKDDRNGYDKEWWTERYKNHLFDYYEVTYRWPRSWNKVNLRRTASELAERERWLSGNCGQFAVAFTEMYPEAKISVEWGTGNDEGYVWHAVAYTPDGKFYDGDGESSLNPLPLHGGDVEMDVAPERVAESMRFSYTKDSPWEDNDVYDAAMAIDEWHPRTARIGGSRLWWRIHPAYRPFGPEEATSTEIHNVFDEAPRRGYSAVGNPWHVWTYAASMGWLSENGPSKAWNDDVIAFTGDQQIGGWDGGGSYKRGDRELMGGDGEPLVIPDMGVVQRFSWSDFERELMDTPFPPGSSFGRAQREDTLRSGVGSWETFAFSLKEGRTNGFWSDRDRAATISNFIIDSWLPERYASKTSSKAWTGNEVLDELIDAFLLEPIAEDASGMTIGQMDAASAHGWCQVVAEQFEQFAKDRGVEGVYATNTDLQEMGYSIQPGSTGGEIGFNENDEMQYGHYPEHTVNSYYPPGQSWPIVIDFTAQQYGYDTQVKISSKTASIREGEERPYYSNAGDVYSMRYSQVDEGERKPRHVIETFSESGEKAGELNWYGTTGTIHHIDVEDGYLRQGIATAMWEWGQDSGRPRPKHSHDRTMHGDAWARSVGGTIPRAKTAASTDGKAWSGRVSALDNEALVSVAEHTMEESGLAGDSIMVPEGHTDDPTYKAAIEPLRQWVSDICRERIRFDASDYILDSTGGGAHGMTTGTGIIVRPVTNTLTVLHECAHWINNSTHAGGHNDEFIKILSDLYRKHISNAAADQFERIVYL